LTGRFSAPRAALGARTIKTGQSRWFVGYKKHSLRLWLNGCFPSVQLVPLVSWVAPANRNEVELLQPSIRYCARQLKWVPDFVVGDKAYIHLAAQKRIREQWGVGVVTRLRADMKLVPPFEPGPQAVCPQGQQLRWLGYEAADQLHWFGVTESEPLCSQCWLQQTCPRQFSYPPAGHEILLGLLPLASQPAQRLLKQVRPWIEASQSYEKNQLGLNVMFLNSLRHCWMMCLLADTVALLRAHALLQRPAPTPPLYELTPKQLTLDIPEGRRP
jgi:hypothetical protein